MHELHPNLPPLPSRVKKLPVDHRGFPVPWFVEWFHADGSFYENPDSPHRKGDYPDFRVVDSRKLFIAYQQKLCWVCGDPLGRYMAFVIGPMCAVNRVSSELPSHRDCAVFAARACPFLTKPAVERRMENLPEGWGDPAGIGLHRNPGVALVWVTESFKAIHVDAEGNAKAGVLFEIGDPVEVQWYAEGRPATRAEIMASFDSGMPLLREAAEVDGVSALEALSKQYEQAITLVPAA
jgi:hypothetical protein